MFYSKFIFIEAIVTEMDDLKLPSTEKHHLSTLLDSSIHHAILDKVMSHLDNENKKLFLKLLVENEDDDKILDFLNKKIENIEEKIQHVAAGLIKEMHKEVKEAKKIK